MFSPEDSTKYSFRKYSIDSSTEKAQQLINSIVSEINSSQDTTKPTGD